MQDLFERILIHAKKTEDLDRKRLIAKLKKYHFVCIRGFTTEKEVLKARGRLAKKFSASRDSPALGESPEQVMGLFQKISLGIQVQKPKVLLKGKSAAEYERPRFLRLLYTPFWRKDVYGFHRLLRRVCQVRNFIYDLPLNFCIDQPERGLWTAARIHQFPQGGGFFSIHRDRNQHEIIREDGPPSYYQTFLVMSRKGKDFESGGGFFEFKGGRFYFEEHCRPGDIGIYDGNTPHGVDPIDPHRPLHLGSINGRMAAFVSFYKDLRRSKTRYLARNRVVGKYIHLK